MNIPPATTAVGSVPGGRVTSASWPALKFIVVLHEPQLIPSVERNDSSASFWNSPY